MSYRKGEKTMRIIKCKKCGIIGHLKGTEENIESMTNNFLDHGIQGKDHIMVVFDSDKVYAKILKTYMDKKDIQIEHANAIAKGATENSMLNFIQTAKNYKTYIFEVLK